MPSLCAVINEWYYDHATHLWAAMVLIDDDWFHIGHYLYEDDAIAAGIVAKLKLNKIK